MMFQIILLLFAGVYASKLPKDVFIEETSKCNETLKNYLRLDFGSATFKEIGVYKDHDAYCISYTCITGYKLNGVKEITCQFGENWSHAKPTCEPMFCSHLKILHGQINCSNSNEINSECSVSCDPKFELKNKLYNTTICNDTAMWMTPIPQCVPKTCDETYTYISDGYVACSAYTFYDSVCKYHCNFGFSLIGHNQTKCIEINSNFEWDSWMPFCAAKTCDATYTYISDGNAKCSAHNHYDSICDYNCKPGFSLIGHNQTKCIDNNSTFEWDVPMPLCKDATCPKENILLQNGKTCCKGADADNFFGSKCNYTCLPGYYLNGHTTTGCVVNNTWSNMKPVCEVRICPDEYLEIIKGEVTCNGPKRRNWYNSQCLFTCDKGYKLTGSHHAKCTNESKWSVDQPKCIIIKCNAPKSLNGGNYSCTTSHFEYLTVCTLNCFEGYELKGNENITCQSNAAWTEPGECAEITCSNDYLRFPNGFVECNGADKSNGYNSRCSFACNLGYVLNGTRSVACQLNGEWDNQKPVCEDRFCCDDVLAIENGEVKCFGHREKNRYGSTCYYSCDKGYELVGNNSILCESNGFWNFPKPICSVKLCSSPSVIKNGHYVCNSTTYEYETSCNLTCNEGYSVDIAERIRCNENAGWGPYGTCIPESCEKNYTEFDNGNVVCQGAEFYHVYGSRCTYSCYAGYVLNGTTNATCNSDGKWSDEKPVCEGRSCSNDYLTIDNGYVNCRGAVAENMYGSTCFYSCVEGYELIGNSSVTCGIDEEWIGLKPKCQEFFCSAIPDLDGGEYICNTTIYKYETTCQLSCNEGYEVVDAANITCLVNKEWSSPGRCIDVQKPIFTSGCPKDLVIFAEKLGLQTYVEYQFHDVIDNAGSEYVKVKSNPEPGTAFIIGTTRVTVTASDKEGNVGVCDFNVTVQQGMCEKPNIDITGQDKISYSCPNGYVYGASCEVSCTDGNRITGPNKITCNKKADGSYTWSPDGSSLPYCEPLKCKKLRQPKHGHLACDSLGTDAEICYIVCNINYTLPFLAVQQYTCSKSKGVWSPSPFPADCFPRKLPDSVRMRPTLYYSVNSCNVDKEYVTSAINSSMSDFQSMKTLCLENENMCNVTEIVFDEMQTTEEAKTCELKITLEIDLGRYIESESPSLALEQYEVLANNINDLLITEATAGKLALPDIGIFNAVDYAEAEFVCDAGESIVYKSMSCAGCGPGSYFDNITNSCVICPYGTYQDQLASFSCILCPDRTTTKTNATTSMSDCQSPCNPGEVSDNGKAPCEKCPVGTYQPDIGKRRCIRCPFGMSTTLDGQTHIESCQFFEFLLSDPSPIVMADKITLPEFTFMTWLHNITIVDDVFENNIVNLTIDSIQIRMTPAVITDQTKNREWNHIALSYKGGNSTLYFNGFPLKKYTALPVDLLTNNAIRLEKSKDVEVKVHGIQLSPKSYTAIEILEFAHNCSQKLDQLILLPNPFIQTRLFTSKCKVGCGDNYIYDNNTMLCSRCKTGYYRVEDLSDDCLECSKNDTVQLTFSTQEACKEFIANNTRKETEIESNTTKVDNLTIPIDNGKSIKKSETNNEKYNETKKQEETNNTDIKADTTPKETEIESNTTETDNLTTPIDIFNPTQKSETNREIYNETNNPQEANYTGQLLPTKTSRQTKGKKSHAKKYLENEKNKIPPQSLSLGLISKVSVDCSQTKVIALIEKRLNKFMAIREFKKTDFNITSNSTCGKVAYNPNGTVKTTIDALLTAPSKKRMEGIEKYFDHIFPGSSKNLEISENTLKIKLMLQLKYFIGTCSNGLVFNRGWCEM